MNAKQVVFTSVLALVAAGAMADDSARSPASTTSHLTRAEVRNDVLQARRAGHMPPAGEAYQGTEVSTGTPLSRAEVKAELSAARRAGELMAAGDAYPKQSSDYPGTSTLTRAEVKAEVVAARKAGEMMPAGEADYPVAAAAPATGGNPFRALAKLFHGNSSSSGE